MKKNTTPILFCILFLASCSWHLQGSVDAGSATLNTLSLSANDIYTPLYRTFKMEYERRRIQLSDDANSPALKLLDETVTNRITSLNTELDPAEDEVSITINYQISLPNRAPHLQQLQLYKNYLQDKNRAAARVNETEKLVTQMRQEAAEKILRQLITLTQAK